MVSTLDSESSDPGSNPGRTLFSSTTVISPPDVLEHLVWLLDVQCGFVFSSRQLSSRDMECHAYCVFICLFFGSGMREVFVKGSTKANIPHGKGGGTE